MGSRPSFSKLPSLEEKVGQLLMVHFNGAVANADARALIQETKVGGSSITIGPTASILQNKSKLLVWAFNG